MTKPILTTPKQVSFFSQFGFSGSAFVGLRAEVDTQSLSTTSCGTYTYTASFGSLTGDFDPSYTFTGGSPVDVRRRASMADVQGANDGVSQVSDNLALATQRISTLESQLAVAQATITALQSTVTMNSASISAIYTLTADYSNIVAAVRGLD